MLDKHSISLALVFIICKIVMRKLWNFMGILWLSTLHSKGLGSIPDYGTKIPQDTVRPKKKDKTMEFPS